MTSIAPEPPGPSSIGTFFSGLTSRPTSDFFIPSIFFFESGFLGLTLKFFYGKKNFLLCRNFCYGFFGSGLGLVFGGDAGLRVTGVAGAWLVFIGTVGETLSLIQEGHREAVAQLGAVEVGIGYGVIADFFCGIYRATYPEALLESGWSGIFAVFRAAPGVGVDSPMRILTFAFSETSIVAENDWV
jgi:hypothetical protein